MGEPGELSDADLDTGAAPPTHAGRVSMPRSGGLTWPTVIGVLCIVFGALGMMYGLMGVVQSAMMTMAARAMEAQGPSGEFPPGAADGFGRAAAFWAAVWALEIPVAGLQIYAGIQLLQRRARGRTAAVAFACLDLALNVLGGIAQYALMSSFTSGFPEGPPGPPPFVPDMLHTMAVVGALFNAIFSSLWPIFLLVWFTRPRVRADVASWRGGGEAIEA